MTVNEAINQAREEYSMAPAGDKYAVWRRQADGGTRMAVLPTTYLRARAAMRAARIERALLLLGAPYHSINCSAIETGRFEDHVRRLAAKAQ